MSRSDLDRIQDQLKVAIQDHQVLVAKMTNDPQNANLQVQLHELQSEIRNLSEKQKSIVEQLRKEILALQVGSTQPPFELSEEMLPNQMSPTDLSYKHLPKPLVESSSDVGSLSDLSLKSTEEEKCIIGFPELENSVNSVEGTPLIKVPDFGLQRATDAPRLADLSTAIDEQELQQEAGSKLSHLVVGFKRPVDLTSGSGGKHALEKKELSPENRTKLEYMASLNLVTVGSLKELQTRRSERKRKSTTNPQFWYGNLEAEYGITSTTCVSSYSTSSSCSTSSSFGLSYVIRQPCLALTVKSEKSDFTASASSFIPIAPRSTEIREDCCTVCHRSGELLMCDVCSLVYHLQCLDPPLTSVPVGLWSCPKCQALSKQYGGKDDWPGTLALVHSYLMHKAAKEEEKKKMQKLNEELAAERNCLERKAEQLREALTQTMRKKSEVTKECNTACQSLENLRNFIRLFIGHSSSNNS